MASFGGLELAALLLMADPFTQPNVVQANLLTQPGAIVEPIGADTGFTQALPVAVLTGSGTLTATLDFPGHPVPGLTTRTFDIPDSVQQGGGPETRVALAFGTTDPCNCNYNQPPLEGVVTLSLDGGPATAYDFGLQLPVPEPTTVLLAATALVLVVMVGRATRSEDPCRQRGGPAAVRAVPAAANSVSSTRSAFASRSTTESVGSSCPASSRAR